MSSCCVIMHHCFGKNFITIIFTEEARRVQICLSPEYFTQFTIGRRDAGRKVSCWAVGRSVYGRKRLRGWPFEIPHDYFCLIWGCLDWDGEFDNGYDDMAHTEIMPCLKESCRRTQADGHRQSGQRLLFTERRCPRGDPRSCKYEMPLLRTPIYRRNL